MPFCNFTARINDHDVNFSIQAEELTPAMAYQLVKDTEKLERDMQREVGHVHHIEYPELMDGLLDIADFTPEPDEGEYDDRDD